MQIHCLKGRGVNLFTKGNLLGLVLSRGSDAHEGMLAGAEDPHSFLVVRIEVLLHKGLFHFFKDTWIFVFLFPTSGRLKEMSILDHWLPYGSSIALSYF